MKAALTLLVLVVLVGTAATWSLALDTPGPAGIALSAVAGVNGLALGFCCRQWLRTVAG